MNINEIGKTRPRIVRVWTNRVGLKLMAIRIESIEHVITVNDAPKQIYDIMRQYGLIRDGGGVDALEVETAANTT